MAFDPTGWGNALSDLFLLINKTLPSDEVRLAEFKLRSRKKYARIQRSMLDGFVAYCNEHFGKNFVFVYGLQLATKEVTDYVTLETNDLPVSEQQLFVSLTIAEWNR